MRKRIAASLLGACFAGAGALFLPDGASARGLYDGGRCEGWRGWFSRSCRTTPSYSHRGLGSVTGVPTEPSVPEPGAAALFALGAALVAARSRRAAR